MNHYLHQFAFQIYPYIALAVFFIGSWARFDKSMYTWRTGSSQLLSDRGMRIGSNCFHIGVLAILGGHLVGLLTPHWLYEHFITAPQKQLLAMVVGGVFGLLCLVGIVILTVRRLFNPRVRATGTLGDTLILLLLLAQLLLGMVSIFYSADHMDGGVMIMLGEWAQHIVTFRWGAADFITDVAWVYKLHIFLGMTLFLVAPFTRLVHVWSIPVSYLWRPYQVVRRRQATLNYGNKDRG
ncbi:MAG: respiratory nitrate reductase subunit gamma [Stenotrophomonas sp.]